MIIQRLKFENCSAGLSYNQVMTITDICDHLILVRMSKITHWTSKLEFSLILCSRQGRQKVKKNFAKFLSKTNIIIWKLFRRITSTLEFLKFLFSRPGRQKVTNNFVKFVAKTNFLIWKLFSRITSTLEFFLFFFLANVAKKSQRISPNLSNFPIRKWFSRITS